MLVNGLPGSGKTTLAVQLGGLMDFPVLSKDVVKEVLADVAGPAFSGTELLPALRLTLGNEKADAKRTSKRWFARRCNATRVRMTLAVMRRCNAYTSCVTSPILPVAVRDLGVGGRERRGRTPLQR